MAFSPPPFFFFQIPQDFIVAFESVGMSGYSPVLVLIPFTLMTWAQLPGEAPGNASFTFYVRPSE